MIFLTMAARVQDGLLLVASTDAAHEMSEQMDVYKSQAKQLLRKLNARSPAKQIIESGPCSFFYLLDQNICYLTLADKGYPRKLLFSYLEEIKDGFIQELSRDFGPEWKRQVETAARPYAFIKFDISQTSSKLVNDSKKYKWGAKKLSMMALYQQYAPFLVLGGIALVVIYLKFFW
ncbi:vesicle-trafficking protein [Nannochloropsis oceanica]